MNAKAQKERRVRAALEGRCLVCVAPALPDRSRCAKHLKAALAAYHRAAEMPGYLERRAATARQARALTTSCAALFALVLACCSCGAVVSATTLDAGDATSTGDVDGSPADGPRTFEIGGDDGRCLLPAGTELVRPCPDGSGAACACEPFGRGFGPCVPAVCS